MRLLKQRPNYGRGPAIWFVVRADEYSTSVRSLFKHPIKAARFLFTNWYEGAP